MLGVSMCRVVWVRSRERGGGGLAGYQPGVYVPQKALFLVKTVKLCLMYRCKRDCCHAFINMPWHH